MQPIEMYARSVRQVLNAFGKDDAAVRVITKEMARFMGTSVLHPYVTVDDRDVQLFPDSIQVCGFTVGLAGVPTHGFYRVPVDSGDVIVCTTHH